MRINKKTWATALLALTMAASCGDGDTTNLPNRQAGASGAEATGGSGGANTSGANTGSAATGGGDTGWVETSGAAGCEACGPLEQCFDGQRCVAKLVEVPGGFSIDATEVTRSQYAAWLVTAPSMADPDWGCLFNTNLTPSCDWPPGDKGNYPVHCVDYCDAYYYCKGNGKRLCGKIGGGPCGKDLEDDPNANQWYAACSKGGEDVYPYGDTPDEAACNVGSGLLPVASLPACQSYPGIYDMAGNVREWVDTCLGADRGPRSYCMIRGGSFKASVERTTCVRPSHMDQMRGDAMAGTGFRCCSD